MHARPRVRTHRESKGRRGHPSPEAPLGGRPGRRGRMPPANAPRRPSDRPAAEIRNGGGRRPVEGARSSPTKERATARTRACGVRPPAAATARSAAGLRQDTTGRGVTESGIEKHAHLVVANRGRGGPGRKLRFSAGSSAGAETSPDAKSPAEAKSRSIKPLGWSCAQPDFVLLKLSCGAVLPRFEDAAICTSPQRRTGPELPAPAEVKRVKSAQQLELERVRVEPHATYRRAEDPALWYA